MGGVQLKFWIGRGLVMLSAIAAVIVAGGCPGGGGKGVEDPTPPDPAEVSDGGVATATDDDDGADPPDPTNGVPDSSADDDDDDGVDVAPVAPVDARFKTSASPEEMSAFLLKPTAHAVKKSDWPLAISLYRGLVLARGVGSPEAVQLARSWMLAGQYDDAIAVLDEFLVASTDAKAKKAAAKERDRLDKAQNPFAGKSFEVTPANGEAGQAFKLGRAAFKKKKYADALLYYRMGSVLAPGLPGFLRELGATYDKLGATKEKIRFYQEYLLQRPFGKNSDFVRNALVKVKGATGKLSITSALPCDDFWMQGQQPRRKLPIKKLQVAPGRYKALCINYKYQIAFYESARVKAGGAATLTFSWAVLVNQLANPFGRIAIEDVLQGGGALKNLSIAQPEQGVVVPKDGKAMRMVLTALDGSKKVERYIKVQAGKKEVIKW